MQGAQFTQGTAGVSLSAGVVCGVDPMTGHCTQASAAAEATAAVKGVIVHPAAIGQPARLMTGGMLDLGTDVLTTGHLYFLSNSLGAIAPEADLPTLGFVSQLGVALSPRLLQLRLWSTGVARG